MPDSSIPTNEEKGGKSFIGKLAGAFSASSKDREVDEKAFFEELLKTVASVPAGRETLKELSSTGCTFTIDPSSASAGGYFCPDENKIVLNTASGYKDFSAPFVHEARHAIQHHKTPVCSHHLVVSDCLTHLRAIEADAVAHESAFIHEIRDARPDIYEERSYMPMLHAYSDTFEATKDKTKAMRASFESWYGYEYYQRYYDNHHGNYICRAAEYGVESKDGSFFKDRLTDETLDGICSFQGKPYVDKAFLKSPAAFSVPVEDKARISEALDSYAQAVSGVVRDRSVNRMYARLPDKTVLPPSLPAERKENKAVITTLLNKKRFGR